MRNTISTQNLSLHFASRQVLDNISIHVPEGEIFGLLGPSGAGKTTLIKILTGQLAPSHGSAKLLGRDTKKLSAQEHRQIGIMMDNFGLYDRLSVYDNLAFYADIYQVSHSSIDGLLKNMGLYESRGAAVSKLSKGMKNRLSLARALLNNPKILFLDEPTAGLDPGTAREIQSILADQRKKGATIFLTTHNMFEAEHLCSHIALLYNGSILERGTPAQICQRYNHLNKLRITLKDETVVILENGKASAAAIKEYLEKEKIAAIHSTEPTLETVFMELKNSQERKGVQRT